MTACAGCGGEARPIAALLLAAPIVLGAVGGAGLLVFDDTALVKPALVATGALFAALVVVLVIFAVRVMTGKTCAGCGRSK